MALVNFSSPFPISPPFFTQPPGYHYPRPQTPFNVEDNANHASTPAPAPPTFTRVQGGGAKTRLHAVIDYDDDYYDDGQDVPPVTPIQGPILLKNGTVPVVPLYSYPQVNNGTFVQIPILWTALSLALGIEVRGNLIRGVPCFKRDYQLYCPNAGNTYPLDRIELFIDENKALMKRMYGEFTMNSPEFGGSGKQKRSVKPGVPDLHASLGPDPVLEPAGESMFGGVHRDTRQTSRNRSETGRVDACESKVEVITPFWASNSAGKVRAIVNTRHFEQAIHQEVCTKARTGRCQGDCGCEQKYKWYRLLAYDPDNDCKGIFMDWFLFPSCCVCRCNPT
ncbi:Spaetzle [Popillia japonica]|uniref:Spaetzle n=1 Tax=Popillia japonica TaxID=7064 RepID=A0AAW1MVW7_POPJA